MKKILIFILFDVVALIILVGLYFAAPALSKIDPISGPASEYENFVNDLFGINKTEPVVERESIDENSEVKLDDKKEEPEEVIEDEVIPEEVEEEEPVQTGPKPVIIDLDFYSDDRVNFTYPKGFQVVEVSDLTLELQTEQGNLLATFDFFDNRSNTALSEFVKQDFILDYFVEAERSAIKPEELLIAEEAFSFRDFPGFLTQDVYLIRIKDYVLLIQVRNQKEQIRNFVVPTLEGKG